MTKRAFILGGTGQIGRAVAARLLDEGWVVTLASRGRKGGDAELVRRGAETITLDRAQPGGLAAALRGGADALIDTVAYDAAHARQLLAVQGDVGAIVAVSSCSVYRDEDERSLDEAGEGGFPDFPAPIREDQPTVDPGPATYSTRKVALEQRLLDDATCPVVILRPCAIHGIGSPHPREWWFVKRMLDRRPLIPVAYRGRSRFHTTATANIAAVTAAALARPATRILNIADPQALSVAEIGAVLARCMDYRGAIVPLDVGDENGSAPIGETPWSTPAPYVLDLSAAAAIGYRAATTYEAAAPALCAWLASEPETNWRDRFPVFTNYPSNPFDYAAEDAFLAAAKGKAPAR